MDALLVLAGIFEDIINGYFPPSALIIAKDIDSFSYNVAWIDESDVELNQSGLVFIKTQDDATWTVTNQCMSFLDLPRFRRNQTERFEIKNTFQNTTAFIHFHQTLIHFPIDFLVKSKPTNPLFVNH